MLKGKELGDAIRRAIDLKIDSGAVASKADIARHFGIKPPSIHDWIKKGAISKDKLPDSEEATFKMYVEDAGKRFLKPLNPQYPILELTPDMLICGVVRGYFMPE